ncbi:MAG: type II toxin-antitoxin system VapC family toxin [Blastocatellia bacterium]
MKTNRVFWDASAIVPTCVHEADSTRARQLLRKYSRQVVWWGTIAEARSAFARAIRKGLLNPNDKQRALQQLERLRKKWIEILPDSDLRDLAVELLDDYPLRTGDALQLAAALISCNKNPHRRVFVCFDDRLATVAEDVGFNVIKS